MTHFVNSNKQALHDAFFTGYIIPRWRRDSWTPIMSRMELFCLHSALKHPKNEFLTKFLQNVLKKLFATNRVEARAEINPLLGEC